MNRRFVLGAAIAGLLFLSAAAWTQDPKATRVRAKAEPTYRDVLKGYVGKKCGVLPSDGLYFLRFPWDKRVKLSSATLTAAGSDFVQLLWEDGTHRYIPLERIELWVKP